jgi:hypothetical protein
VDDTVAVRAIEGVGNLGGDLHRLVHAQLLSRSSFARSVSPLMNGMT